MLLAEGKGRAQSDGEQPGSACGQCPPQSTRSASSRLVARRPGLRLFCVGLSRRFQRWLMVEDRALKLLQHRSRLEAKLVDEGPAGALVSVERFGLSTRAIEREHEVTA